MRPSSVDVRFTRTALAGGGVVTVEERTDVPGYRLQRGQVRLTQSIGAQGGQFVFKNPVGTYDAFQTGDNVKVEAKLPEDAAYTTLMEGFIGEPAVDAEPNPRLTIPVVGMNALLDLVFITADTSFAAGTTYTSMVSSLGASKLPGWTITVTGDAAVCATGVTFLAGTKLRQALDFLRRALIAATASKWEYVASKSGATRTLTWFKRSTSSQATITAADLLRGTGRGKGSVLDVINQATVNGATVERQVVDKTAIAHVAYSRLDAVTKRVAQPFTAEGSPLYSVTARADRSVQTDPPTLQGFVARDSDNVEVLNVGLLRGLTATRTALIANASRLNDGVWSTAAALSLPNDNTWYEVAAYDLAAARSVSAHAKAQLSTGIDIQVRVSNDDVFATATAIFQLNGDGTTRFGAQATSGSPDAFRYVHVAARRNTASATMDIHEVVMARGISYGVLTNAAVTTTSSTGLKGVGPIMDEQDGVDQLVTDGGSTEEVVFFGGFGNLSIPGRGVFPGKVIVKHADGITDTNVYLRIQSSLDNVTWYDIAYLPSTTSTVTDTVFSEDAEVQLVRVLAVDNRAAASGNRTQTIYRADVVLHRSLATGEGAQGWGSPLVGDSMNGSDVSWDVGSLVQHPGYLETRTYPAPRLALFTGEKYWFVWHAPVGAGASSWWDLSYGTDGDPADAAKSTDSGATYAAIAADATLLHLLGFDNAQLVGTALDAASQTLYANLIPGGVLAGGYTDETLVTQDMVDREAAALVQARKNPVGREVIVTRFRPDIVPGSRVTLDATVAEVLGVSGGYDVVEVVHDLSGNGRSTLILSDHLKTDDGAFAVVAGLASGRSL